MEQELHRLQEEARQELNALTGIAQLEDFRIRFLGRKGSFGAIMRSLGSATPKTDRPGQLANTVKAEIERLFEEITGSPLSWCRSGQSRSRQDRPDPARQAPPRSANCIRSPRL